MAVRIIGLLCFLISLNLATETKSFEITGKVIDQKTGSAIEFVNVSIAYSMLGSSTNKYGDFKIKHLRKGKYNIIISCIGYYTATAEIELLNSSKTDLLIKLKPKVYKTGTVKVTGEEAEEWQDNYELFKEAFVGTTPFSKETTIEDPYKINFEVVNDELKAFTEHPIILINKALGYKITYHLENFSLKNKTTKYSGLPYFEKLEPESEEEKLKWKENRESAYKGSFRHFLTSICKTKLNKKFKASDEGFFIQSKDKLKSWFRPGKVELKKHLKKTEKDYEMLLSFKNFWSVKYKPAIKELGIKQIYQRSWIKIHGDSAKIDIKGRNYDKYKIETFGHWAYARMADILPFDYQLNEAE